MATKNSSGISSLQRQASKQSKQAMQQEPQNNQVVPDGKSIETTEPEKESPIKRKVGRPKTKTEKTKTINIAVPISVLEKLNIVKACYGNNLTQYINKLIEKDIEANFAEYERITYSLNTFK